MNTFSKLERKLFKEGNQLIAGVDEAGRGPLAGPVVAAAVVFPENVLIKGIEDSKVLSKTKREMLELEIKRKALSYFICVIESSTIDKINILNATLIAMKKAVESLALKPDVILVDGNKLPDVSIKAIPVIKGDKNTFTIAAASILAKVHRDRIMFELSKKFPQYGFDSNKGYPTRKHIDALLKFGACEIHRKKFLQKIFERYVIQQKLEL